MHRTPPEQKYRVTLYVRDKPVLTTIPKDLIPIYEEFEKLNLGPQQKKAFEKFVEDKKKNQNPQDTFYPD